MFWTCSLLKLYLVCLSSSTATLRLTGSVHTISFGYFHILPLPQCEAALIKVCSLQSLLKTIHKACAYCLVLFIATKGFLSGYGSQQATLGGARGSGQSSSPRC